MTELKPEVEGIVRDTTNGALLNKDNTSLEAYKRVKKKNYEIEEMKVKVNNLTNEISDIKTMLGKVLEKL